MKLIALITVVTILGTTAIRVPTTWRSPNTKGYLANNDKLYRPIQSLPAGNHAAFFQQPPIYKPKFNYKVNRKRNHQQRKKQFFNKPNDWVPIVGYSKQSFKNPLLKNYRDDKTYEPDYNTNHVKESFKSFHRENHEKAPISDHEEPLDIPTKPIYPGEGKWAMRGRKYKPFISPHKFTPQNLKLESRPDGYETFEQGAKLFQNQRDNFGKNFEEATNKFHSGKLTHHTSSEENEGETEGKDSASFEDNDEHEFVPTKLYAQVRRSENEEHLPLTSAEDNGKLREVIKDSKIQTVYTEEGYEDSAYDHAGHEKKAQNEEGYSEFDKDIEHDEDKKVPNPKPKIIIPNHDYYKKYNGVLKDSYGDDVQLDHYKSQLNFDDSDSFSAGSHYEVTTQKPKMKKVNKNNFIKTKETKTMALKDTGNGNMQMEISSEVKVITQPNNSTKSHKYVKIYPKIISNVNTYSNEDISNEITTVPSETTTTEVIQESPLTTESSPVVLTSPKSETAETTYQNDDSPEAVSESIETAFLKLNRRKRFANDFPKVEIDTDFIDQIDHHLPLQQSTQPNKYPYYKSSSKFLNENSPLRYSEDLSNIPDKTSSDMAFYQQADQKFECPDVETDVDPIPDHVKNAEKSEDDESSSSEVRNLPETPRLGSLGDKIDCFKLKYFGANPLDSPIFSEEMIEPVKPIFNILSSSSKNQKDTEKKYFGDDFTNKFDVSNESEDLNNNVKPVEENPEIDSEKYEDLNDNVKPVEENPEIDSERYEDFLENKTETTVASFDQIVNNDNVRGENNENQDVSTEQLSSDVTTKEPTKDLIETTTAKDVRDDNEIQNLNYNVDKETEKKVYSSKFIEPILKKEVDSDQIKELMVKSLFNLYTSTTDKPVDYLEMIKNIQENNDPIETTTLAPATPTGESVISIITTPNYTIDLKPKHIYDQIELLQYLPLFNRSQSENKQVKINREGRILNSRIDESSIEIADPSTVEPLPEVQALIKRRRRYRPKYRRPEYHVFDINRYYPTTPIPIYFSSTVLPKQKVLSEVFYKNDIKPIEQLNVFSDVINNIKNSSLASKNMSDAIGEFSEPIGVQIKLAGETRTKRIKIPIKKKRVKNTYNKDSYMTAYDNAEGESQNTYVISSTTNKPFSSNRGKTRYHGHKSPDQFYEELLVTLKNRDHTNSGEEEDEDKLFPSTTEFITRKKHNKKPDVTENPTENEDYLDNPATDVLGLMPPGNGLYKTIYSSMGTKKLPTSVYAVMEEAEINKFLVPGMKPPDENQKVYLYSDYKIINRKLNRRHSALRRSKRSPNRPAYSELSRNRGHQDPVIKEEPQDDEIDDYVPHRSRNFHYDEKTGKIVYDKKNTTPEPESDVEYVEIYEEPVTEAPKPTTENIFATATPPPAGLSYVDFVKKLKNNKNYKEIPDPTTTEKGQEATTTATTTLSSVLTTPPAFLSILAKVRDDNKYKVIEDDMKTKSSTTTTEIPVEDEEEEEEEVESQIGSVQNSPGGQGRNGDLQIFDINDFLPNVRNYMPRTSIDTSKYKTIARPSARHNISSRYNSDDKVSVKGTQETIEATPEATHQTEEIELSTRPIRSTTTVSTSTTTNTPSTTIKKRLRGRNRTKATVVSTTETPSTSSSIQRRTTLDSETRQSVQNDRPHRNYRRRPTRIKLRSSTEKLLEEDPEDTTKVLRRRSHSDANDYEHTTRLDPIVVADRSHPIIAQDRVQASPQNKSPFKRKYRITTPEDQKNFTNTRISKPGTIEPRKILDVEVFKKYNPTRRHGGNYMENLQESRRNLGKKLQPPKKIVEIVPKPVSFYTDPKLPSNVNQLKETVGSSRSISEGNLDEIEDDQTTDEDGQSDFEADDEDHIETDDEVQTNVGNDRMDNINKIIIKDPSKRMYYYVVD